MGFGLIANSVLVFFFTYLKFTSDLCNEVLYRLINEYLMHIKLLQMLSLYMSYFFLSESSESQSTFTSSFGLWEWTSFFSSSFVTLYLTRKKKQISNLNDNSVISKHSDPA